jgi:pyridoxine kinase
VTVAAKAIGRIRQANPRTLVLIDPILGDAGRLYVAEETAEAIRDELLPLADVATPNLFELQWLSGAAPASADDVARSARALGRPRVVVTSAAETPGEIATLLVGAGAPVERRLAWRGGIANGAGDLFAGLLLGHLLRNQSPEVAFDASLTDLDRVLAASERRPVLDLSALDASRP